MSAPRKNEPLHRLGHRAGLLPGSGARRRHRIIRLADRIITRGRSGQPARICVDLGEEIRLTFVEAYAEHAGTDLDTAIRRLLDAGLCVWNGGGKSDVFLQRIVSPPEPGTANICSRAAR